MIGRRLQLSQYAQCQYIYSNSTVLYCIPRLEGVWEGEGEGVGEGEGEGVQGRGQAGRGGTDN